MQEVYIDLFDQLDEALVQALSKAISEWAPGLVIQSIRVTKPVRSVNIAWTDAGSQRIPDAIKNNYEAVEAERTKYALAEQKQRVAERNAQNERERAKIEAQKKLDVSMIECSRQAVGARSRGATVLAGE